MGGSLTFADIATGASVFVDANIFVYHFIAEPKLGSTCTDLLERIERAELLGFTSSHVLAEVAHRLMTIEACDLFGWPIQGIAPRLRRYRAEIRRLKKFRQAITDIRNLGMTVLPVSEADVANASDVSLQQGLLTNDSLLVALMQAKNLSSLASNDSDFDTIPGLSRFAPV